MRVDLLGPLRVRDDTGADIAVPTGRQRALLTRLALEPGRAVRAAALVAALWPEHPPANAPGALHTQISRLRRLLGERLGSDAAGYRLTDADTDVAEFERLADAAETAARAETHDAARRHAEQALDLWRGPALADAADLPFADTESTRLTARRDALTAVVLDARLHLDGAEAVVAELAARHSADPLAEPDTARYMRALAATGRQSRALAVYETTRERLADELGVDPSPALAAAHLDVLRGIEAPPVPDRSANLPEPLSACIGRDADLAAVDDHIATGRLVTITGPGGTGKTRIAVEAAHRAAAAGRTVRLVELAPVSDARLLPDVVLDALRLGESFLSRAPADARERLVEVLRNRRLVLVFDNCEHLIDDVADLAADLLARVPGLRLLATSREPLGITGERVHPLGPLALPEPGAPLDDLTAHAAVRLFAERGREADPGFAVDAANAATAARVCTALDGLPLAIELAAARLRTMSLDDLAARLDDRFALLNRGDRTAAPRQRTLRGVVDWSWDLLDPGTRRLLARMSVFNGGADLDAITGVCSATVDQLADLVDKSLVQRLASGRYRLLETVREYAAERLVELGETARRHRDHARHYAALARGAEPHLMSAAQIEWLDRLGVDHGNLVAAVHRMIAAGDAALANECMSPLAWYWWMRGYRKEGRELAFRVRDMEGEADPLDRAKVCMSGTWGIWSGELDPAEVVTGWQTARALADEHDLWDREPVLQLVPAFLAVIDGDGDALHRYVDELPPGTEPIVRGMALLFCHGFSARAGQEERALAELIECNAIFESIGERFGLIMSLQSLAAVREEAGETAEARRLLDRAYRAECEFGAEPADSVIIESLWRMDAEYGDDPAAVLARIRVEAERAALAGNLENTMAARTSVGICLRRLGRFAEAREALLEAEAGLPPFVQYSETALRLYKQLRLVAAELGDRDLERRAAEHGEMGMWPFSS